MAKPTEPRASAYSNVAELIEEDRAEKPCPRRLGRPRGPERVPLTVRILAAHNERLTAEVAIQGLSPQYLVERALADYFARLDRLRGRAG